MKTLLVDGNNLLSIGFHAVSFYHNNKHLGGIFHVMNTIKNLIRDHNFHKVIVFWDGEQYKEKRRRIYPDYKIGRKEKSNEDKEESFNEQKRRVQQYMEEIFIRQIEVAGNEADDLISLYCSIAGNEEKVIVSSDKDLLQLISPMTSVYSPIEKRFRSVGDKVKIDKWEIPVENILTYKILLGDKSDNIKGIYSLGNQKLFKYFPEILEKPVIFTDLLQRTEELLREEKSKVLLNILNGKRDGKNEGVNYYEINSKLMDLSDPLVDENGRRGIMEIYSSPMDPTERGHKNLMRMMMEDGIFKFLVKEDDQWVDFIRPFLKLIRKEEITIKKFKVK